METTSSPSPGPESATSYLAQQIKWIAEVGRVRQFWKTREAIHRGEELFDFSRDEIANRKLMGPLAFNVYETTLAAMPGVVIGSISRFIWPSPSAQGVDPVAAAIADVAALVAPFIVPTYALFLAWVVAWASLRREDRSRVSLRRARDAYLYLDGAYGLLPETLASFWFYAFGWGSATLSGGIGALVYLGNQLVGLVGAYHFYGEQLKGIPSLMFAAHRYDTASPGDSIRMLDVLLNEKKAAPWRTYRWAVVGGSPLVFGLVFALFILVSVLGGLMLMMIRSVA